MLRQQDADVAIRAASLHASSKLQEIQKAARAGRLPHASVCKAAPIFGRRSPEQTRDRPM